MLKTCRAEDRAVGLTLLKAGPHGLPEQQSTTLMKLSVSLAIRGRGSAPRLRLPTSTVAVTIEVQLHLEL